VSSWRGHGPAHPRARPGLARTAEVLEGGRAHSKGRAGLRSGSEVGGPVEETALTKGNASFASRRATLPGASLRCRRLVGTTHNIGWNASRCCAPLATQAVKGVAREGRGHAFAVLRPALGASFTR